MNKGLFVNIDGGPGAGERYQITHPVAHVNGLLRGSFYATVHESTIVTCNGGPGIGDGEMLRAIIEYKEEVRTVSVCFYHPDERARPELVGQAALLGRRRRAPVQAVLARARRVDQGEARPSRARRSAL